MGIPRRVLGRRVLTHEEMFASMMLGDGRGGVIMPTAMMVATRKIDLNLNHAPADGYEDPIKEGLKQAMIQHEIVFKNQLQELHRLFWAQKNLMNKLRGRRSELVAEAPKAEDAIFRVPMIQMRNYDLELAADEFIGDATEELTDEFEDGNSSACNVRLPGVGHMNLDLNTISGSLEYNSALRKTPNESCHTLTGKYSHSEHQAQGRQNQTHSIAECREHGSSLSSSAPCKKQQTKSKCMHFDLNIAQDEEPCSLNNVEPYPSPSTSSSVVLHGDNLRPTRSNRNEEESNVSQYGVPSLGSEYSGKKGPDSFLLKHRDLDSPSVMAFEHSNTVEKNQFFNKYVEDGERCRSECSKVLLERFPSVCNREARDNGNETIPVNLHKPLEDENIVSAVSLPISAHNDSRKNISSSCSYIEHNCLLASAASINLPLSVAGGLDEKHMDKERSEEDTVSSHAIAPDDEQDELKEPPDVIMLNHLTRDGECNSKTKIVEKNAVISNPRNSGTTHQSTVMPARICGRVSSTDGSGSMYREENISHNFDLSQPKEDIGQVRLDTRIKKAAETLVSISSDNPSLFFDQSTSGGQMKFNCDEGNVQPQCCDSFEALTLDLEDIGDNGSSVCVGQIDDKIVQDVPGIRLRRGSRLRDFQKDILPGIVSLSRHEICADLYAIKYELRKQRSRCKENVEAPVIGRRLRFYAVGKRR